VGDEFERGDLAAVQPVPLLLGGEVMEFEHDRELLDLGADRLDHGREDGR
jgi:imidazole glycerol phosphate synthase subunit HisF